MNAKFECALKLRNEGIPECFIERWLEAIVLKPNLSELREEVVRRIFAIPDSDILDLLTVYGEEGSPVALESMIRYFVKFYGLAKTLPVIVSDEEKTMSCRVESRPRSLRVIGMYVNPVVYNVCDGASLLVMTAHEMRHAWQLEQMDKWLVSLCGTEIDFDVDPREARQELLFYLNYRAYVRSTSSKELYDNQLIEQDAYYVTYAMLERIGMFSRKVQEKMLKSMKFVNMFLS